MSDTERMMCSRCGVHNVPVETHRCAPTNADVRAHKSTCAVVQCCRKPQDCKWGGIGGCGRENESCQCFGDDMRAAEVASVRDRLTAVRVAVEQAFKGAGVDLEDTCALCGHQWAAHAPDCAAARLLALVS